MMQPDAVRDDRAERYVEYVEACRDDLVASAIMTALAAVDAPRNVLIAEARSGAFVRAAAAAYPDAKRIMAVESDRELLDVARATTEELEAPVYFAAQGGQNLAFADGVFDGTFGANAGGTTASLMNSLAEVVRVTRAGGVVGLWTTTSASFARWRELLREAAWASGDADVNELIDEVEALVPSAADIAERAAQAGIDVVGHGTIRVPFLARTGAELARHPFVDRDFAELWRNLAAAPAVRHALLVDAHCRADAYYAEHPFEDELEVAWVCGTTRAAATAQGSDA
jgi:SAM-dependent methyltransferase